MVTVKHFWVSDVCLTIKSAFASKLIILLSEQTSTIFLLLLLVHGSPGGVDLDMGLALESAFDLGFSCQRCLDSWTKIGAITPLTCKCLDDPQLRQSIDIDMKYALLVNSIQEANEYAMYALSEVRGQIQWVSAAGIGRNLASQISYG